MASYTYKEIERALLAAGFKEIKNNGGSHQMFVHEATGFPQTLPKHSNGQVASGTAESILDYAVVAARISNINIASDRYKLGKNVVDYIKKRHIKAKENSLNWIPDKVRTQSGIETPKQAKEFLQEKIKQAKAFKANLTTKTEKAPEPEYGN